MVIAQENFAKKLIYSKFYNANLFRLNGTRRGSDQGPRLKTSWNFPGESANLQLNLVKNTKKTAIDKFHWKKACEYIQLEFFLFSGLC